MACSPLSHRQRYWQVPHATHYAHSYGSLGCDRSLVILQFAMHNQIPPTMPLPPSSTPPSLQTSSHRTSMGCTTKPSSTFGTSRGGTRVSWSCTVLCTCVAHISSLPEAPLTSYVLLQRVRCSHGHTINRQKFQDMLAAANPQWKAFSDDLERTGARPRTNPDGDVCSSSYQCDPFEILTRLYRLSSRKARDTTSLSCPIARVAYARSGQIR